MRILLDECVPRRFRQEFPEHVVRTVPEMGWASFQNGDLLAAASGKLDALIATDQRLNYQHNVSNFELAVVRRNKLEFLLPLVPALRKVPEEVKPGEVRRVGELAR